MLLSAAARSAESPFLLMAYGQLWDAEVVVRSAFEASLKFAYIVQDAKLFKQRYNEFAEDQFQMSLMKDDQKARDLLEALRNPQDSEWKPIRDMVLADSERERLRATYDKATRRSMETRWGYAGLLDSLVKSGEAAYSTFAGLARGYALASHIQHADYVGVSIPLDRDRRAADQRDTAHMAHLTRLVSDCFSCFELRLGAAYRFVGCDVAALGEAFERIQELRKAMEPTYGAWMLAEYGTSSAT